MGKQRTPAQIVKDCRNSAFNINRYSVDIGYKGLWSGLASYSDFDNCSEVTDSKSFFKNAIPEFQRANNKWNEKQQVSFIENLMLGFRTSIKLFSVGNNINNQVIDGLQRLTAIAAFLDGNIKAHGLYADEYKGQHFHLLRFLNIEIYSFKEWVEVGRFYIQINEGITHSPEDIDKCKKWFKDEKGIIL